MNEEVLLQKRVMVFAQETVTHFQCNSCETAWAMGDFDRLRDRHQLFYLHCPVCGVRQRLERPSDWHT